MCERHVGSCSVKEALPDCSVSWRGRWAPGLLGCTCWGRWAAASSGRLRWGRSGPSSTRLDGACASSPGRLLTTRRKETIQSLQTRLLNIANFRTIILICPSLYLYCNFTLFHCPCFIILLNILIAFAFISSSLHPRSCICIRCFMYCMFSTRQCEKWNFFGHNIWAPNTMLSKTIDEDEMHTMTQISSAWIKSPGIKICRNVLHCELLHQKNPRVQMNKLFGSARTNNQWQRFERRLNQTLSSSRYMSRLYNNKYLQKK